MESNKAAAAQVSEANNSAGGHTAEQASTSDQYITQSWKMPQGVCLTETTQSGRPPPFHLKLCNYHPRRITCMTQHTQQPHPHAAIPFLSQPHQFHTTCCLPSHKRARSRWPDSLVQRSMVSRTPPVVIASKVCTKRAVTSLASTSCGSLILAACAAGLCLGHRVDFQQFLHCCTVKAGPVLGCK